MTPAARAPESIGAWLVERVAHYVQLPVEEIDPDASPLEYGLDSLYAVVLCGDIEDTWGLAVEPDLVWEADTLAVLGARLADLRNR
ncbi:polyketide synthase [Streptomyces cinnamoneus]|uniref:Polyketide synthase n=1 Tax=Streptomyces cinnamoneus TaxID=53446 RepID=A0A2G1XLN9_STRCJ|nr:polyketide synthase [Streptomyces cinnamoneus]PPT16850.1 polyketide synthase [Streptomyces cinnamoneus]